MIKIKTFKTQSTRIFVLLLLSMLFLVVVTPAQAKTSYVSDELNVPMRSGASNGHRILKFLKSGTALTVLGASDDNKFVQVQLPQGKSGWIAAENLMDVPSGRARLVSVNAKLAKSKQDIKELKASIAELKAEVKSLNKEKALLQSERTNLSNSLDDIKITAANPLALSKKNKQLKKELDQVRSNEAMLEKDNQHLRSNESQEWFMIGGSVAMGSLILGLIITRINWRRKRSSWGDNF